MLRIHKTGKRHRHHLHSDTFPVHLKSAVNGARIDIRTVQELLGHKDVKTNMIYTHVMNRPGMSVISPSDRLALD